MMDRSVINPLAPGHVKLLCVLLFTLLMILPAQTSDAAGQYRNMVDYDDYFLTYSSIYFGSDFDWRCFKAQAIVESNLQPHIQSQDGSIGIMQIQPRTFREIVRKNPHIRADPKHPRWNIAAGIYYNRLLWGDLPEHLAAKDRVNLMLACYNTGGFKIMRARQTAREKGLDPGSWEAVARILFRAVNGPGAATVFYVKRINDVWLRLLEESGRLNVGSGT